MKDEIDKILKFTKMHSKCPHHIALCDGVEDHTGPVSVISGEGGSDEEEENESYIDEPVPTREQVDELLQDGVQAKDDYEFSCMAGDMEMEQAIVDSSYYNTGKAQESTTQAPTEKLGKNRKRGSKRAAPKQDPRELEQRRLELERFHKITSRAVKDIKEHHERLRGWQAEKLAAVNGRDEKFETMATGWAEFCKKHFPPADVKS